MDTTYDIFIKFKLFFKIDTFLFQNHTKQHIQRVYF